MLLHSGTLTLRGLFGCGREIFFAMKTRRHEGLQFIRRAALERNDRGFDEFCRSVNLGLFVASCLRGKIDFQASGES